MMFGVMVLTYHFLSYRLSIVVGIFSSVISIKVFQQYFTQMLTGEQAFLQLKDSLANFSWLISLDHVKTSTKRSTNYMMKAIGANFGSKLATNLMAEAFPLNFNKQDQQQSSVNQIPQAALAGLGVLGVLGVPVGISVQPLPGMFNKADNTFDRPRQENAGYTALVAEAQDNEFLLHQSLAYFEELEDNRPKDPYIHFLKIQWLLEYFPALSLILLELEKMESKVSSLKEHIQLFTARSQVEKFLETHYQMVSHHKKTSFNEVTVGAFGWSAEAINKTDYVRHPYKIINTCKPTQLDLGYVFFYKNRIEGLVSRISKFSDQETEAMVHLEEKKGEKSKLMGYVRRLYQMRDSLDDYFNDLNQLTQKTDFKHYIPYISHLNFNLNLQESARHLLSQYSARQSMLHQCPEFKEAKINNINMMTDNLYLLLSSNRKSFGTVVDVYGSYQLFANNHNEIIGKNFEMFLTPTLREYHKTFVEVATSESMDKFRLFGAQFSGFVKVPSRDLVVYANTTVKVVPYAENEFKYITLVKPLLNIFEDKFFILLDGQLNVEAYSYNFLDILPSSYLGIGASLNTLSTLVYHRVLTLKETRNATVIASQRNQGGGGQGGNQVGSSDIFPATPMNNPGSPSKRLESKTRIGSTSGIHLQDKDIYNGSAAMATNLFNFGDFMPIEGNNYELDDVLRFPQEGSPNKMVQKGFWINICYKPFLLGKEDDGGYFYLVLTLKDDPNNGSRSADSGMHGGKGSRRHSLEVKDDISIENEPLELEGNVGSKVDEQKFINEASWIKGQNPENKDGSQELPVGGPANSAGAGASIGPAASGGVGAGTSADPTGNKASSSSTLQVQNNLIGSISAPAEKPTFRNPIHRNSSGANEQSMTISNAPRKVEMTQNTTTKYNSAIGNIDSGFAVSLDRRISEDRRMRKKADKEDIVAHESASQLATPSEVAEQQGASSSIKRPLNLNAVLNTRAVTRKYDYTRKRTFGNNQKQKLETIGEMSAYERANSIGLLENDVSRKTEQFENKESFGSKYRSSKVSKDHVNYERAILKPPLPMLLLVQIAVLLLVSIGLLSVRVTQYNYYESRANELSNLVDGYHTIQSLSLKMVRAYGSVVRAIALNTGYTQNSRYANLKAKADGDSGTDMQQYKTSANYSQLSNHGLYLKDQLQTIWADLGSDREELDTVLQSLPAVQTQLLSKQASFSLPDYSSSDLQASYQVSYSIFEGYFTQLYASEVQLLPSAVSFFDLNTKKSPQYFFLVANFIQAFTDFDSGSASNIEQLYDVFVQNYFRDFLFYLIGYGSGLVLFATVLVVVLVLSLIHFNGILENIFICQPHEILEKKKSIQKVISLCQLHRHDNYFFFGTLKDHDLESVSIDSKALNKFTAHKSKGLQIFGLLRAYMPEIIAIIILVILLVASALDYNNRYQLFKKYSDQMTVVVRAMKIQVEANTLLTNNLILSNSTYLGQNRNANLELMRDKLSQLSSRMSSAISIADSSYFGDAYLDNLFQTWFAGDLCSKFLSTKQFAGLCRSVDNKVGSEGVLQVLLRVNRVLVEMYNLASASSYSPSNSAAYLNSAEYAEHEYMFDKVYFASYMNLTTLLFDQVDSYFRPLMNQNNSQIYTASDVLTGVVFFWSFYVFWQFGMTHNKIMFLFFIIPMRSVISSNYLRMRFLSLYRLPRTYFGG